MENNETRNTKKEITFTFASLIFNTIIAIALPYFLVKHYVIIEVSIPAILPVIFIMIFAILEMLIAKFLRQQKGNTFEGEYNLAAGVLFCSMILMFFPYLVSSAISMPEEETKLVQSKLNTDVDLFILKSATDEELIKAYNQIKSRIDTKCQEETYSKEQKTKNLKRLNKTLQ